MPRHDSVGHPQTPSRLATSMAPPVTILLPTLNERAFVTDCLDSLRAQDYLHRRDPGRRWRLDGWNARHRGALWRHGSSGRQSEGDGRRRHERRPRRSTQRCHRSCRCPHPLRQRLRLVQRRSIAADRRSGGRRADAALSGSRPSAGRSLRSPHHRSASDLAVSITAIGSKRSTPCTSERSARQRSSMPAGTTTRISSGRLKIRS